MQKKAREMGLTHTPTLAPNSVDRLMGYHWPGNVRELQNAVEQALILGKEQPLTFEDLEIPDRGAPAALSPARLDRNSLDRRKERFCLEGRIADELALTNGKGVAHD
jgi:DNA-binding NtrC family response regulator